MVHSIVAWLTQADGWIHWVVRGQDLPAGPLGVALYAVFVPGYWWVSASARRPYLIVTSLLLALLCLGPSFTLTLSGLIAFAWILIHTLGVTGQTRLAMLIHSLPYVGLLVRPSPFWLPEPGEGELAFFYFHFAGLGYLYLKASHVLIDVACGRQGKPGLGDFLAYLLFAPTLRMGPIYRFQAFVEQLGRSPAEHRDLGRGVVLFGTGLLRLAMLVGLTQRFPYEVFIQDPASLRTPVFAACFYTAPMLYYLMFSAYVDFSIALGCAMGFHVPENFRYPWLSTSIAEFWRRWHITLGAWLRDYVYIPLGGNRRHVRTNYLLTFLFSGLWHGMGKAQVVWGLSQALGMTVHRQWGLFWKSRASGISRRPHHSRLVNRISVAVFAWLVTFHYQAFTLIMLMDQRQAGWQVVRYFWLHI